MAAAPLGFYTDLLHREVGSVLANVVVVFMIGSFLLGMNAASAGGARTLYGMAKAGMTVRWLDHLSKHNVPNRGMYVDVVANVLAVLFLPTTVAVLAVSNLGYVLCHVLALSAVVLLRKDRPGWPRPLRLGRGWVVLAGVLAAINAVLLVVGALSFSKTGYGGPAQLLIGVGLLALGCLLYAYRQVVQEKRPFRLRDTVVHDEMPPAPAVPALALQPAEG
jgi:amino acid transporter